MNLKFTSTDYKLTQEIIEQVSKEIDDCLNNITVSPFAKKNILETINVRESVKH